MNFLSLVRGIQPLQTDNVAAETFTTGHSGFVNFCVISFSHAVFFCFKLIEGCTPTSPSSCCTRAFLSEARVCRTSDPSVQSEWASHLHACHSRRYQSYRRTLASSAKIPRLVVQHLYVLASCFVTFVDDGQDLGYWTTALAPPYALFPPSKTKSIASKRYIEAKNKTHSHFDQYLSPFWPGDRSCPCHSARARRCFCFSSRSASLSEKKVTQ